ncbi:MAG: YceD family protein [Armatimonadota bacterium]
MRRPSMHLDLSEIVVREGMRADVEVDQPSVEDPDLVFAEPVRGKVTFTNGGDLINIDGQVETTLLQPCSRCLTDVRVPVKLEIDEHFPIDDVLHPNRPPAEDEDYDTVVSSVVYLDQGRPILDLEELLRQLIVAEVPIRTLCDDACSGLCPQCGANLNDQPCTCERQAANTPLAGLAALLEEQGEESGE